MAFVCHATWHISSGNTVQVWDSLRMLTRASRAESGNLYYQPYFDPEQPDIVKIFEVYEDEAAFAAHRASEHFATYATGVAFPLLEGSSRDFWETIED